MQQKVRMAAVALVLGLVAVHPAIAAMKSGGVAVTGSKKAIRKASKSLDNDDRMNVNNLDMFVTNHGSFGWDLATSQPGLRFPNGTLKTALFASQAFVAAFRSAAGARPSTGSIINVSSTYGVVTPDQTMYEYRRAAGAVYFKPVGYSVAKSGVLNFTRWLAEYCAPLGIRVNTLVPGGVQEPGHPEAFVAEYVKRTPLGRMARDDDYNGAVLFLAAPRASGYMTGATLVVDGGWTAR